MDTISLLINLAGGYFLLGAVFGIFFIIYGLHKAEPKAARSGFWFRLIILPGTLIFWPFMLRKWMKNR